MKSAEFPKVVCWDLDGTLGNFERISYQLKKQQIPSYIEPISLRFGIKKVLSDLSNQGYVHYVTTSAGQEYAQEVIKRTGLSEWIEPERTYDGFMLYSSHRFGKDYGLIEESAFFGDTEKEIYKANMIVVGDAPGDQPAHLEHLVFVQIEYIPDCDAVVIQKVMEALQDRGEGSFKKGFDVLYKSTPVTVVREQFKYEARMVDLGNGIRFAVDCREIKNGVPVFPKIHNIEAPDYEREPKVLVEE